MVIFPLLPPLKSLSITLIIIIYHLLFFFPTRFLTFSTVFCCSMFFALFYWQRGRKTHTVVSQHPNSSKKCQRRPFVVLLGRLNGEDHCEYRYAITSIQLLHHFSPVYSILDKFSKQFSPLNLLLIRFWQILGAKVGNSLKI